MARADWEWAKQLVLAVLMAGMCSTVWAQAVDVGTDNPVAARVSAAPRGHDGHGGMIAGRLTDLGSMPQVGVNLIARNEATGAEARTTTGKNGSYRLTGLAPGVYTLEAESPSLGRGRLQGIYVAGGGYEAHVQAAMAFQPKFQAELRLGFQSGSAAIPATVEAVLRSKAQASPSHGTLNPERDTATEGAGALPAEALRGMALAGGPLNARTPVGMALAPPEPVGAITPEPLLRLSLIARAEPGEVPSLGIVPTSQDVMRVEETLRWAAVSAATAAMSAVEAPLPRAQVGSTQTEPIRPATETTMSAAEVQALPASGRRWQDFLLDTPSKTGSADGKSGGWQDGVGTGPLETSLDGASMRLAFGGSGGAGPESSGPGSNGQGSSEQSGMGRAWAASHGAPIAEAAIHEVQMVAGNAEAEANRAAGGQLNLETARGTNGLRGQAFIFDKQNTWGAQNPFTQWVKATVPATLTSVPVFTPEAYTPPDHEAVWGFGAGSQIKRDKLFWFAALDRYSRNDPGLATVKHPDEFFAQPSNDQMQVLSARLGLSGVNPVAEGLSAYSQILTTLDDLLGPAPRTAAQWVGFGRLDWDATERHRFTLEATGAHWNSPGGGLTRVSETYGTNSFGSSRASEFLLLGRWEAFLTPNLLTVTQGSFGRTIQSAEPDTPSAYEQSLLSANSWGQLPQIVVDSRYGFTIGNPSRFGMGSYPDEHVLQAQEMVSWVRGNLLLKSGFDVSHNADATSLLRNETGTYNYSSAENFASDALVFAAYGLAGEENPDDQHDCDQTGKVWRDGTGTLHGLGYLPCYSYYSQTLGPTDWHLSTNDWAAFATAQWQPNKLLVVSGGLRWEREQLPPVIAALNNPELPLTEKLPSLGNNWGPRIGLALGSKENRWPVLRLGYGIYFGRTENPTVETALTQTGSLKGDLNFFMRPTDDCQFCAGGAPPFPYVLTGAPGNIIKPGAVEFASSFRNPEVHQAVAAVEEELPAHVQVTASGLFSFGRLLPISIDTNFDPAVNPGTLTYAVVDASGLGPIKTPEITVPFYASWPTGQTPTGFGGRLNPDYQQITQIMSRSNSTYEAAMVKVSRYGRKGLSLHARYTFAHAADWNPNESTTVAGSDVLDPADFHEEYGTSNLDVRHSAAVTAILASPWKIAGAAGRFANNWMLSGVGQFRSGLPFTMRTSGSLAEEFNQSTGAAIVALGPGMNGSGGDNRVYGVGRNTYRYPSAWKADLRVGKKIDFGHERQLELLVESFNLFNHQNVTELETTGYYIEPGDLSGAPPTLNFLTGLKANTTEFGQPLNVNATNFYRERQIQVGVRARF